MTQNLDAIWRNFKSTVYNSIVVFIWFRETLLPADFNENYQKSCLDHELN